MVQSMEMCFSKLSLLPSSGTHALLQPLVELEAADYVVTLLVSDSGSPSLRTFAQVNVTVCICDSFGDCKSEAGAIFGSSVGINFIALIIIMACIALLLCKILVNLYEWIHTYTTI